MKGIAQPSSLNFFRPGLPARLALSLAVVLLLLNASAPGLVCRAAVTPDPSVWSLVWSDEFNGATGTPVDSTKWTAETGGNGWGNNELEYYTNRTQNADQENGALVIKALKETYTGPDNVTRNYTSARLITKNKFTQTYGRFEARLKLPFGQGF